jgi:16S rRNA (guanine527-N7)-methyltransferase
MRDGDSRDQSEIAVFSLLERGLATLSLEPDSERLGQLAELVFLLSHWAQRINLTGHRDPVEMTGRLVLDAAALTRALPELDSASSVADLGSGAGFPGLPLAILHPRLDVHLVDSRLKRHHFQREARRKLKLSRVHSILGRSDQVEPVCCDIVVAQAMSRPERALELMIPWAKPNGLIVLPASQSAAEPKCPARLGEIERRQYSVPETHTKRVLWLARLRATA